MAVSAISLHQDFLGKEGYIQHVTNNWTSAQYTVPISIVLMLYSLCVLFGAMQDKH